MLAKFGFKQLIFIALISLFLTACSGQKVEMQPEQTKTPVGTLQAYVTITPGETIIPDVLMTETPFPSPSPTPRTHSVKQGEDLGGIAYQYRVSLEALLNANPEVSPRALSVGTILVIPPSEPSDLETTPIPTPMQVSLNELHCVKTNEGGAFCFVTASTDNLPVENVSAEFRIFSQTEDKWKSKLAVAPLNLLKPGVNLPLAAYFPPPLGDVVQSTIELRTALPVLNEENRYPSVETAGTEVKISEDGQSALVSGDVILHGEKDVKEVWVVFIAYDQENRVVGIRRWESGDSLSNEESVPFSGDVYSTSGKIDRVEFLTEAHT